MYRRRNRSQEGWLISYADLITNLLVFFTLVMAASTIQTGRLEKISEALNEDEDVDTQVVDHESLTSAVKKLDAELQSRALTDKVSVQITDDGLELAFNSGVIFNSGSDQIIPEWEATVGDILNIVKPYANRYKVAIEGHTDERPIHTAQFRSNWELASARAMSIRERMEAVGVDRKRVRVESYADNKALPEAATAGLSREEMLAKHRRVVIRLY